MKSNVYREAIMQLDCGLISETMVKFNNNQSQAARYLGINRNTLRSKLTMIEKQLKKDIKKLNNLYIGE